MIQEFDASKANFGVVADSPKLLNINYNAAATQSDWIHINSIDYNPALDKILLSSHNLDEIWIIDHSTTTAQAASHSGGNSDFGGDILYRWGNQAAYNSGTVADQKLYGQHNANWIASGLPFENKIMIFNNGIGRPGGNYSTVEIINPPVNNYSYTATIPYLPESTLWNYNYGNPNNLYSQNISGAQQLSNGNVLVCSGGNGIFTETTTSGTQVWKYTNPVNNSGAINQGLNPTMNAVFRCVFYPTDYIGFLGNALLAGNTIENSNTTSDLCSLNLSINDKLRDDRLVIYPNPSSDRLNVILQNQFIVANFALINSFGQIVYQETVSSTHFSIDIKHFASGMYYLIIKSDDFQIVRKVVVDK